MPYRKNALDSSKTCIQDWHNGKTSQVPSEIQNVTSESEVPQLSKSAYKSRV